MVIVGGLTTAMAALSGPGAALPGPATAEQIGNTAWVLLTLDDKPAPFSKRWPAATVTFHADGSVDGTSACNHAGGAEAIKWKVDGRFVENPDAPLITTTALCNGAKDISKFGDLFWFKRMEHAKSWVRRHDRLTIRFSDGHRASLALRR